MLGYHRGLIVVLLMVRPLNEANVSVLFSPTAVEGQKSTAVKSE